MTVKIWLTGYLIWLAVAGIIKTARESRYDNFSGAAGSMIGALAKHVTILGGLYYCGFWG